MYINNTQQNIQPQKKALKNTLCFQKSNETKTDKSAIGFTKQN